MFQIEIKKESENKFPRLQYLNVNNEEVYSGNVSISGNTTGKINVNAVSGDYIELLLTDVKSNGRVIKNVKSSDKFIY